MTCTRVVGYARVSTEEQNMDVQLAALRAAGVEDLFKEKISAVNAHRDQFKIMMKHLQPGDTLVLHALSRLGRDSSQIDGILKELKARSVKWRSLTEPHLDIATASGQFMINMTSAMAQFERDQVRERTKRGMDECRRKGMYLGRPLLATPAKVKAMQRDRRRMTAREVASRHGVSVATVNKHAPKRSRK